MFAGLGLSLWLSRKVGTSQLFSKISLGATQETSAGFIGVDMHQKAMIGKTGIAYTVLRPSGRIQVEGELFDAKSEIGYIENVITSYSIHYTKLYDALLASLHQTHIKCAVNWVHNEKQ